MIRLFTCAAAALAVALGAAPSASAGAGLAVGPLAGAVVASPLVRRIAAGPDRVAAMLQKRGYRKVRIADDKGPGHRARACKGKTEYRLEIDARGRIVDVDRIGRCSRPRSRDGVHVKAPFADVRVDRGGVRVRAPYVDIGVPRRP